MSSRFRDESSPASLWDAAGDEDQARPQEKPRGNRSNRPRRSNHHQDQSKATRNIRPEEVSERVWGLAEQWLEMAAGQFGKRPPINKQDFSRRLAIKINGDQNLRRWLKVQPDTWETSFGGRWKTGQDFVNDVLAKTLELFFGHLTVDQKNTALLQFDFLDDEWDEWIYQAITAVQAGWHKEHSEWVKYALPGAVFDPSTVGIPEDDQPCTDPEFAGMTWGEVRALAKEDQFESRDDSGEDPIRERMEQAGQTFARLKSAMVANRKTTTKETTSEDPA